MQTPRADTAQQEGVAELVFAGDDVGDVTEGPVVRINAVHRAGIDHAGDRVVPQVLLVDRAGALNVAVDWVLAHQIARVSATDSRGLHAAVSCQVGGAKGKALHAR